MNENQVEAWRAMIGGAMAGVSIALAIVIIVLLIMFLRAVLKEN